MMIEYIDQYSEFVKSLKVGDTVYVPAYNEGINYPTAKAVVIEIHKIKTMKRNAVDSFMLKTIHSFLHRKINFINTHCVLTLTKARDVLLSKCLQYDISCQENVLINTHDGKIYNIKECAKEPITQIS